MIAPEHRALAAVIDSHLAERVPARVQRLRRCRSDYSTSAPIDEIDAELTDGSVVELMGKQVGRAAQLGVAGEAKPQFLYDAAREAIAYRALAGQPGLAEWWGTVAEPQGTLLLLERVPGLALRHVGDFDRWLESAAWLAAFHLRWAEPLELAPAARAHLLAYDRAHHEQLLARAVRFGEAAGAPVPAAVVAGHAKALELVDGLPRTLVHGEFYPSNVVVRPAGAGARVAVIDWETAGVGCPLLDLAALTSGEWKPAEQAAMVEAYRRIAPLGLEEEHFQRALCAARLLVSVRWMGWAAGWEPPGDLLDDWPGHARSMAESLLGPRLRPAPAPHPDGWRAVVVNADDLGMSESVNRGIFEAHDWGIVTSASLLVRGVAAQSAARAAATRPSLSVGLHLDLGEWALSRGEWRPVYEVVDIDDDAAVRAEVHRQLHRFAQLTGHLPTHVDSHQHVHLRPGVAGVVGEAARDLRVPCRRAGPIAFRGEFYGQHAGGEPYPAGITLDNALRLLADLAPGVSELSCHPGYDDDLVSSYGPERAVELRVLCDPRLRAELGARRIELLSFAVVPSLVA